MSEIRQKVARRFSKFFTASKKPSKKSEARAADMSVAFPLYIYPSAGAWSPLLTAIGDYPSTIFNLVINPNNGPGGSIPDSNYIANVSDLNSYDNVNLFGYVYTSWGGRNLTEVESDISTYNLWGQYTEADIHVDGIFFDEAPTDTKFVPYMSKLYNYTKSELAGDALVWTNPGVAIDAAFYNVADYVNAYENSWQYWSAQGGNSSIPKALRAKSTVAIHGYNGTEVSVETDVDDLVDAGYGACLLTSDSTYTSFGEELAEFLEYVSTSGASSTEKC